MSETLTSAILNVLGSQPPARIGVAVSGGGDSMALLLAMAPVARARGITLEVVTVDHGLRSGTEGEVALVTGLCQRLGLNHHVEYWGGWTASGNLQAQARDARYALIADWAMAQDIAHVALAHTVDDQAETVLMRLARTSGVDGLSGMAARRVRHGITWLRPFLRVRRAALRDFLRAADQAWADDPSNDDPAFERVRVREALAVLDGLGISAETLGDVSRHMQEARAALDWQTFLAARDMAQVFHGAVALDLKPFRTLPVEIQRRMLVNSLTWLAHDVYPPRREAVAGALEAMRAGRGSTLGGVQITVKRDTAWLHRELRALDGVTAEPGEVWDDRWTVSGPDDSDALEVRALGTDALTGIEGWRDIGVPRAVLAVTPGVWDADELVAAPVARPDGAWSAEVDADADAYFAALLSH